MLYEGSSPKGGIADSTNQTWQGTYYDIFIRSSYILIDYKSFVFLRKDTHVIIYVTRVWILTLMATHNAITILLTCILGPLASIQPSDLKLSLDGSRRLGGFGSELAAVRASGLGSRRSTGGSDR